METIDSKFRNWASQLETMMIKAFKGKRCEASILQEKCKGKVIESHSISRKFLKSIANSNNEVYCFDNSLFTRLNNDGYPGIKKVGISKASVYNMFCGLHDNNLFLPIEDRVLIPDEEQCFWLFFRASMMEKYLKEAQVIYSNLMIDFFGKKLKEQDASEIDIRYFLNYSIEYQKKFLQGVNLAIQDIDFLLQDIIPIINNKQYCNLHSLRIFFTRKPKILCTGVFHPEYDFNGNNINNLLSETPIKDMISISIVPLDGRINQTNGCIVLSWIDTKTSSSCSRFIDSIRSIRNDQIINTLIYFIFEYCENICISPDWYENLDETIKEQIINLNMIQLHEPHPWNDIDFQGNEWKYLKKEYWDGKKWDIF